MVEQESPKASNIRTIYKTLSSYSEEQIDVYRHNYVKLGFLINTIALGYAYMLNKKRR